MGLAADRQRDAGAGPWPDDRERYAAELLAVMVDVWRALLGRPDLDADGNFFLAGGDSLNAVQLLKHVAQQARFRIPLATLLDAPTPREFTSRIVAMCEKQGRRLGLDGLKDIETP